MRFVRAWAVGAAGVAALVAGAMVSTPSHAADEAEIYLVQGLPDRRLDVRIDGKSVAEGVEAAKVAGPFEVSAGTHEVSVADGGEVVVEKTVEVDPDGSSDVVVHLPTPGEGDPVMTVYDNDLSAVPADKANLTVAHTAAVPPADITVNGKVLFRDIANGEALNLIVPVATYTVAIVPTGEEEPVLLGPVKLSVEGGALNRVYAVGDPAKKTMNVAVHVIEVDESGSNTPKRVDTGTGGQAEGLASDSAASRGEPILWVDLTR